MSGRGRGGWYSSGPSLRSVGISIFLQTKRDPESEWRARRNSPSIMKPRFTPSPEGGDKGLRPNPSGEKWWREADMPRHRWWGYLVDVAIDWELGARRNEVRLARFLGGAGPRGDRCGRHLHDVAMGALEDGLPTPGGLRRASRKRLRSLRKRLSESSLSSRA